MNPRQNLTTEETLVQVSTRVDELSRRTEKVESSISAVKDSLPDLIYKGIETHRVSCPNNYNFKGLEEKLDGFIEDLPEKVATIVRETNKSDSIFPSTLSGWALLIVACLGIVGSVWSGVSFLQTSNQNAANLNAIIQRLDKISPQTSTTQEQPSVIKITKENF